MSTSVDMEGAGNNGPRRCAACKYLRRQCPRDCVLAPHFPASDPRRYACVQRFFGAGNVARMLQQLPAQERGRAANAMAEEAWLRAQDPVYGCAGVIHRLQEEIGAVQCELARTRAQVAMHAQANQQHQLHLRLQEDLRQMPFDQKETGSLLSEF